MHMVGESERLTHTHTPTLNVTLKHEHASIAALVVPEVLDVHYYFLSFVIVV